MTTSPHVSDLKSAQDFEKNVIERSKTVPVVVDFWAPWCGPCRVLGPVIEKEIDALGGQVELVKVNTDAVPGIAEAFGIQGIPAVKAFSNAQLVAEFSGAQPAAQVKKFLEALLPSDTAQGMEAAEAAMKAGLPAEAEALLRPLISIPATDVDERAVQDRALILLARALLAQGRPTEVPALLARVDPDGPVADQVASIERQLQLDADAKTFGGEAAAAAALESDPKNLDARYALASALAARGAHEEALTHFLEIVSRNRKFRDDGARKAMVAIFDQRGTDDLVHDFRRRLQIVL